MGTGAAIGAGKPEASQTGREESKFSALRVTRICESFLCGFQLDCPDRTTTAHVSQQMFHAKQIGFQRLGKPHK
jgi:hypothetical protein